MRGDPGRTSDDLEALDAIEQAAQRARRIVDSMLRFSRRETSVREVDLSEIVGEAGALFHVQAKQKPRVMFVKELAEGLPKVMLNAGQIEQVVLNLLQNALNALPDAAGTIGVRTEAVAGALRLTVWDTGVGIPPEHLARIFEVGFTTKSEGSGTGFGLAIVSSIVEAHKGVVRVESTVGQGTRFIIDFPLQEVGHGE
jgi:two-component system NtrC family sensor kinase